MMRYIARIAAAAVVAALSAPAFAQDGQEWWVIVGYVDHEPYAWTDEIMATANQLNTQLAACGLTAFWDFAGKFDGLGTEGRGTVIVVSTTDPLTKEGASRLLDTTKPCVPDAYIKSAHYVGE